MIGTSRRRFPQKPFNSQVNLRRVMNDGRVEDAGTSEQSKGAEAGLAFGAFEDPTKAQLWLSDQTGWSRCIDSVMVDLSTSSSGYSL